jgi:hypothetical protein
MPMTHAGVFIIESLAFKDEKSGFFEGEVISKILNFSSIEHQYYYIRTRQEFEHVIGLFKKSKYRYLHISCHGNGNALYTTLDEIPFNELRLIFKDALEKKRLFVSACSVTNNKLAEAVLKDTNCYSLIGPAKDINMDDAAIFWASFYQIMFKKNPTGMNKARLENTLKNLLLAFEVPIRYYSASEKYERGWIENKLKI